MQAKRIPKTGAQRRAERMAAGLPRYSGQEALTEIARSRRRAVERRVRNRDLAAAIKLERGCADCGFRDHPAALEFDHLPGYPKVASVALLCTRADSTTILAEIAKCEVVCANCHRVRTHRRTLDAAGEEG